MNWYLDVFADDCTDDYTLAEAAILRLQEGDMTGPCEDSDEATAPFIGMCPDESSQHEDGSPLDFVKGSLVD
jgi:hypothetical protein